MTDYIWYVMGLMHKSVFFCDLLCKVVATFQRMRQEQRSMASKVAELEMNINEHRFVEQFLNFEHG